MEKIFLQNNNLAVLNVTDLELYLPNLSHVIAFQNPLATVICPRNLAIQVLVSCDAHLRHLVSCKEIVNGKELCCCHHTDYVPYGTCHKEKDAVSIPVPEESENSGKGLSTVEVVVTVSIVTVVVLLGGFALILLLWKKCHRPPTQPTNDEESIPMEPPPPPIIPLPVPIPQPIATSTPQGTLEHIYEIPERRHFSQINTSDSTFDDFRDFDSTVENVYENNLIASRVSYFNNSKMM